MERDREKIRRIIAKILTIHGYRNSPIEDIHAQGRISDKEMKHLNKTIHNQIYTLLTMIEDESLFKNQYFTNEGWGSDWDDAELLPWKEFTKKNEK